MNLTRLIELQKELSQSVISKNQLTSKIKAVCGVDVSYKDNRAFCSAIILDIQSKKIIGSKNISCIASVPYIPGLFMLREAKPILLTLKKLQKDYDVLLVDGHGRLHPRKCGLACYIGLKLDKPVIGVAKKLLCGKIQPNSKIEFDSHVLGYQIMRNKKSIYVSTGHKVNLRTAKRIVELTIDKSWYPEPLRLADRNSKLFRNSESKREIHVPD